MKALYIVDVQYDFLEGGKLEIKDSNKVVPYILNLLDDDSYDAIYISMDWHPFNHISFGQWPEHCVQFTKGSCTHEDIERKLYSMLGKVEYLFKGEALEKDEYSAVPEHELIFDKLDEFDVVGLATDYCVKETSLDLLKLGKRVNILLEGCCGVDPKTTLDAIKELRLAGAKIKEIS